MNLPRAVEILYRLLDSVCPYSIVAFEFVRLPFAAHTKLICNLSICISFALHCQNARQQFLYMCVFSWHKRPSDCSFDFLYSTTGGCFISLSVFLHAVQCALSFQYGNNCNAFSYVTIPTIQQCQSIVGVINMLFCQYLLRCFLCFNRLLQRNNKGWLQKEICNNNRSAVLADIEPSILWALKEKFPNKILHITSKQQRPDPLI